MEDIKASHADRMERFKQRYAEYRKNLFNDYRDVVAYAKELADDGNRVLRDLELADMEVEMDEEGLTDVRILWQRGRHSTVVSRIDIKTPTKEELIGMFLRFDTLSDPAFVYQNGEIENTATKGEVLHLMRKDVERFVLTKWATDVIYEVEKEEMNVYQTGPN